MGKNPLLPYKTCFVLCKDRKNSSQNGIPQLNNSPQKRRRGSKNVALEKPVPHLLLLSVRQKVGTEITLLRPRAA